MGYRRMIKDEILFDDTSIMGIQELFKDSTKFRVSIVSDIKNEKLYTGIKLCHIRTKRIIVVYSFEELLETLEMYNSL
jgi:hypothetical protein